MKIVREHINEKFTEKSDPIHDMGIGTLNRMKKEYEKILGVGEEELTKYLFPEYPTYFMTSITFRILLKNIISFILHEDRDRLNALFLDTCMRAGLTKEAKKLLIKTFKEKLNFDIYVPNKPDELTKVYEKFSEGSDPIHDMGIGTDPKNPNRFGSFIISQLPDILNMRSIPDDIINDSKRLINSKYEKQISDYITEILVQTEIIEYDLLPNYLISTLHLLKYDIWTVLYEKLQGMGFKTYES